MSELPVSSDRILVYAPKCMREWDLHLRVTFMFPLVVKPGKSSPGVKPENMAN